VTDVAAVIGALEELAPVHLAEDWDHVGLQVGDPGRPVSRVLVGLEVTEELLAEVEDFRPDLVVTHHPLIFTPIDVLRTDRDPGRKVARLLAVGVSLYVLHTNYDVAPRGLNDHLAQSMGLSDVGVLGPGKGEELLKLAVFVPRGHVEDVMMALTEAGAGWIGNYSHCTFQVQGTGTFRALEGTDPFLGEVGQIERVEEVRLETILPARLRSAVLRALLEAHPYEEVAYDLYPLLNEGRVAGLGRVGSLPEPLSPRGLVALAREVFGGVMRFLDGGREIRRVAVCAGAGSGLLEACLRRGVDAYVTGELGYHQGRVAQERGLTVVEVGHANSEYPAVGALAAYLREAFPALEVREARHPGEPLNPPAEEEG